MKLPQEVLAKIHHRWVGKILGEKAYGGQRKSTAPLKFLTESLEQGAWKGRRCFIIGGGPSLKGFDFSLLAGDLTIGTNRAYEFWDPTVIFSMDSRYYSWIHHALGPEPLQKYKDSKAFKVWVDTHSAEFGHEVQLLKFKSVEGLSTNLAEGVCTGRNSGYAALNLALLLGADPIILLGFDMTAGPTRAEDWFHDGYPRSQKHGAGCYQIYRSFFYDVAAEIIRKFPHQRVYNFSMNSSLGCFPFPPQEAVRPSSGPVYVSYYTKDYQEEAEDLRRSLHALGLKYCFSEMLDLGSWQKNTQQKARFLSHMLDVCFPNDLVWLDADAVVRKYPKVLQEMKQPFDFAYHRRTDRGKNEILSGTLFLRNNHRCRKFVEQWIKRNDENPEVWEQKNLQAVVEQAKNHVAFLGLPPEYCQIYDSMKRLSDEPVIEHFQASRRLKK